MICPVPASARTDQSSRAAIPGSAPSSAAAPITCMITCQDRPPEHRQPAGWRRSAHRPDCLRSLSAELFN